jgi:allantoinase
LHCPRAIRTPTVLQYLKDTFDALYAEGDPDGLNAPKMMSMGMHCRLLGRPGRITALQRFLDHIAAP